MSCSAEALRMLLPSAFGSVACGMVFFFYVLCDVCFDIIVNNC